MTRGPGRTSGPMQAVFRREFAAGISLSLKIRLVCLAVTAGLLVVLVPPPALYYIEALIGLFVLLALVQFTLARSRLHRDWHSYAFVAIDFALITFATLYPNPLADPEFQIPQQIYRFQPVVFVYMLVASAAIAFSPWLMIWAGTAALFFWTAGFAIIASLPETRLASTVESLPPEQRHASMYHPRFVDDGVWLQGVVVLALVVLILTGVVWRARRLVERQANAARERSQLARYFPSGVVDELVAEKEPFADVRTQDVAVLFVDVVGWTRLAESLPPEASVALLRDVHRRVEHAVFENGGTLDKFLGDGAMATFGTPRPGPADAAAALAAARAVLRETEALNTARRARGVPALRLVVGGHFGPVTLGDIGSERRLEFAVLGDCVNVASRLEELNRTLGSRLALSDALIAAARAQGAATDDLVYRGPQNLRGREVAIGVWTDGPATAGDDAAGTGAAGNGAAGRETAESEP